MSESINTVDEIVYGPGHASGAAGVTVTTEAPAPSPVDEKSFATRQETARRACESVGITWPATILPEGTALYTSGVDKLRSDRARWAKLPDAHTGVQVITAALAAEDRRDIKIPIANLQLSPVDGRLQSLQGIASNKPALGYNPHGFRQLVNQLEGKRPSNFAGAILSLDSDERAAIMNRRLPASSATVTLRTKVAHSGQRVARAVLSEKYGDLNDIHVAEAIEFALNGNAATAKLDYKPGDSRSQFEVIFPSEIPVGTFAVGDIHYAGFIVSNSETGEGSANVRAFLMRAACANLTLAAGEGVAIRHIGKSERLQGSMRAAVQAALLQLDPLIALIQRSAGERLSEISSKGPTEIIAALAKKYALSEERAGAWATMYDSRYAHSPTTWGVTSALTEAAQSNAAWYNQADEESVAADVMAVGIRKALGF